jgi:hypothetical protein
MTILLPDLENLTMHLNHGWNLLHRDNFQRSNYVCIRVWDSEICAARLLSLYVEERGKYSSRRSLPREVAVVPECPCKGRILLVLPQVRRGILDGSTTSRGVYEPPVPHKRAAECREALPLGFWRLEDVLVLLVSLQGTGILLLEFLFHFFFLRKKFKRNPCLLLKKTEGAGIPQVLRPSTYVYVKNITITCSK